MIRHTSRIFHSQSSVRSYAQTRRTLLKSMIALVIISHDCSELMTSLKGVLLDPINVGWNTRVHRRIFRVGATMRPRDQSYEFSLDGKRATGITLKSQCNIF